MTLPDCTCPEHRPRRAYLHKLRNGEGVDVELGDLGFLRIERVAQGRWRVRIPSGVTLAGTPMFLVGEVSRVRSKCYQEARVVWAGVAPPRFRSLEKALEATARRVMAEDAAARLGRPPVS